MCHACRKASVDKPAKCGGWNHKPCNAASSRDHLLRRKDRTKSNNPIVIACRKCNTRRGHDDWTPYEKLVAGDYPSKRGSYPLSELIASDITLDT
jgi:hypothetical protein